MVTSTRACKVWNALFIVSAINILQPSNAALEADSAILEWLNSTFRTDFVDFTLKILHVSPNLPAISPAGSRDFALSRHTFDLGIGFVVLADQIDVPHVDQCMCFFHALFPFIAYT